METNKRIREEMARQKLTMTELANRSGLNRSSISRYVADKVEPKPDAVVAISKALNVSPEWLIGLNDSKAIKENKQFKPVKLSALETGLIIDFRACSSEDKLHLLEYAKLLRNQDNGNT